MRLCVIQMDMRLGESAYNFAGVTEDNLYTHAYRAGA